jgi:hypothetical protein
VIAALKGQQDSTDGVRIHRRTITEALGTGLSRPPAGDERPKYTLADFATVMRGVVTGDNDFFLMTGARARELGISRDYLLRVVARTRDIKGSRFTEADLSRLDGAGRPTYALNLDGSPSKSYPLAVQTYIEKGESTGLPHKPLIKARGVWYRAERRKVPPIMFAYLGRSNVRFILNEAGVVPLTCLACVYPLNDTPDFIRRLWQVLNAPTTIANLSKVGKSYGGGAVKVEPRSLEKLPLDAALVEAAGLQSSGVRASDSLFA